MGNYTCPECRKEYQSLGIMRHRTMHAEDRQRAMAGEIVRTVHDGDCPRCGFPETVYVRDSLTMDILREECSKRSCHWNRKLIPAPAPF